MGHPDFRVNNRVFASLRTVARQGTVGMVKVSLDDQERFVTDPSGGFTPEVGAWGRAGCTRVLLDRVDEEKLGEALTLAWQDVKSRSDAKPPRTAKKKPVGTTKKRR